MPPPGLGAIDLNLLVVLAELLATPSTVEVARRLGRTQSAISHALARLRVLLRDPLFVRVGRVLVPTRRAEALSAPLSAWLREATALLAERADFEPRRVRRTFRVGTVDLAEALLVPAVLRTLATEAPEASLAVEYLGDRAERAIQQGEADLAMGFVMREADGLLSQTLWEESFVCLTRAPSPTRTKTARPAKIDLASFLSARHVLVTPRGLPGSVVDRVLEKQGHRRHVVVKTPSFLVAAELVATADVMLTCPRRFAETMAARHGLVVREAPLALGTMPFRMIFAASRREDPEHRFLRALFVEAARQLGVGARRLSGPPRGR